MLMLGQPASALNIPVEQLWHADALSYAANVPAAQAVQLTPPDAVNVPAVPARQTVGGGGVVVIAGVVEEVVVGAGVVEVVVGAGVVEEVVVGSGVVEVVVGIGVVEIVVSVGNAHGPPGGPTYPALHTQLVRAPPPFADVELPGHTRQ